MAEVPEERSWKEGSYGQREHPCRSDFADRGDLEATAIRGYRTCDAGTENVSGTGGETEVVSRAAELAATATSSAQALWA